MPKVTIVKQDEDWDPVSSYRDYEPYRYEAELINVVRVDGKWVGVVMEDQHGTMDLHTVDMTEVAEWQGFDHERAYSPPEW